MPSYRPSVGGISQAELDAALADYELASNVSIDAPNMAKMYYDHLGGAASGVAIEVITDLSTISFSEATTGTDAGDTMTFTQNKHQIVYQLQASAVAGNRQRTKYLSLGGNKTITAIFCNLAVSDPAPNGAGLVIWAETPVLGGNNENGFYLAPLTGTVVALYKIVTNVFTQMISKTIASSNFAQPCSISVDKSADVLVDVNRFHVARNPVQAVAYPGNTELNQQTHWGLFIFATANSNIRIQITGPIYIVTK